MKNFKEISAVIVDDEQNSKEKVFNIINSHFKYIKLETADNVKFGIEVINRIKPQIVFLDIDMPDGTGFYLLNGLDSYSFKVIFITAHQEHALRAIKFSALDYILKLYSSEELITATNNALN